MKLLQCQLRTESAFATPVVGDTLFGHLCWAIRMRFGNERLESLLAGYTDDHPFLVVSDMIPDGVLPRPTMPQFLLSNESTSDVALRKTLKAKRWMPVEKASLPLNQWLTDGLMTDNELLNTRQLNAQIALVGHTMHQHNSLNRLTNTTGKGAGFAPYQQQRIWYHPDIHWQLLLVIDEARLSPAECQQVLEDVGLAGYGRDASSGLGKFSVLAINSLPEPSVSDCWLALAPVSLSPDDFVADKSYYQTTVRFGRHGNTAVHSGNPFKKPILLAQTGALLTAPVSQPRYIAGHGIRGISDVMPETVHQGYAPVWPVTVKEAL
ncbi:hypothetical protein J3L11_04055 [Shewanella sp. 4t3-1-2LB]|uniref:type III-A CRISPR-associated RAMP protein Csm4 n=1 Tax=Shewanella sp. 4t3-1-2LB TaxID=2817682 RepID=UPI001A98AE51|nr:hypothetical protein [Shewanella sp. 4t3-1-2LB]MBO1270822.1 hypothetical protein [Shewanella sp. 4t3-1-2LB]